MESTDESGTEETLTNNLGQPGQVAAFPHYENFAEADNLATDGRRLEKKRIHAVRETIPGIPIKYLFQVEAGQPAHQTAVQAQANKPDRESCTLLTWGDGLEQLKAFKVKHGHVDVPVVYTNQQNLPLRSFVRRIRKTFKNIQEGRMNGDKLLSDQRILELERTGFKFQLYTTWGQSFEELRQHFQTHGNLKVPKGTALRGWIYQQRSYFKMMLKARMNSLSEKRIDLLNSIGLDWRVDANDEVKDQASVNADQGR